MSRLPSHIAIIMDGNGRWARARGRLRIQGHREGSRNVHRITIHASERGIKVLTLYAFSEENWSRPPREVSLLMMLLKIYAVRERELLMKKNVRMQVIGDISKLPDFARRELLATCELTAHNTGMILQLALSYGGRAEIIQAMKRFANDVKQGRRDPESLTEDAVRTYLSTGDQPDPDLIIRTSGEQRLSNFLLWQGAYAELCFVEKAWPEFTEQDFDEAIDEFSRRERRFGGLRE